MSYKVKIPKGLPLLVMDDKESRKMLDTFLRLKAIFTNGYFKCDTKALKQLEPGLKISYKTILKRLRIAQNKQLLTITQGTATLKAYGSLSAAFGCQTGRNYYIKADSLESVSLEHILDALAIKEKQEECKNAYNFKISKYGAKEELKGVIPGEVVSFTQGVTMAHLTDYLSGGNTPNSYLFKIGRADFNLSYRRLSQLFSYKSKGGLAYKKRLLVKKGLIQVESRSVAFDRAKHTTKRTRNTELGNVHFQPQDGTLRLTLPDSITFTKLNQIPAL